MLEDVGDSDCFLFLLAAFHMYLDPKGAHILCKRLILIYG